MRSGSAGRIRTVTIYLRINRGYLQVSDYCSVTVRVRVKARDRGRIWVRLGLGLRIVVSFQSNTYTGADNLTRTTKRQHQNRIQNSTTQKWP